MVTLPLALASTVALADGCGVYPLTAAQAAYLQTEVPDIEVPEGEVPFVQRCDLDANGIVDNNDLFALRERRGEAAAHPDDPADWDGDGVIHGRDVGGCASSCSNNGCAVKDEVEEQGLLEAQENGTTELPGASGACFQADDFDGDGKGDFLGVYEYTGSQARSYGWGLQVVILTDDGNGDVQHTTIPYTGQLSDGNGDLLQHVSLQPAGVVDLNPGTATLTEPGIVSYRNGEPKMLIYFKNGVLTQAFFGIDD
jgi:hypothetical protein